MKTKLATCLAVALLVTALAQGQQKEGFAHYRVIDLGTLGGPYSFGFGISSRGVVVGDAATAMQNGDPSQSIPPPPQTGFLWERGRIINLGTLGNPSENLSSGAAGPNIHNEAALGSETAKLDPDGEDFCYFGTHRQCLAALWKRGKLSVLPTLRGYDRAGQPVGNSQAYDLNDRDQVAGFSETDTFDPTCATPGKPSQRYRFETVIWGPNGRVRELHPFGHDTVSFAFGINNEGQVVGGSGICSNTDFPSNPMGGRSVLWQKDGTPIDLGNLGGRQSLASSINDRGDVTGASSIKNGPVHAYLWTKERRKMRDLGTLHPDDQLVVAPCCRTVNNSRQVVGFLLDANFKSHAFLWHHGVMKDLNDLIAKDSGWNLQAAQSINDAGQIVGTGLINGEFRAFLATPCHDHDGRECCEDDER